MRKGLFIGLAVLAFLGKAKALEKDSTASHTSPAHFFRHIYENDFFDATDRYYTQGLRYELFLPLFGKSPVAHLLPGFRQHATNYFSISLMQDCFTPSSIRRDTIFTGDRPFAATAYLRQSRVSNDPEKNRRLTTDIDIGAMGPCAKCEEEQKAIHRALVNIQPLGWQFQMKSDLILDYSMLYEKAVVMKEYAEVRLQGNATVGTLYDFAGGGAQIRTGKMLSYYKAFGPGENKASSVLQCYAFLSGNAKVVGYNATMEGGVFDKESVYVIPPSAIERVVGMYQWGIVLSWKRLSLEYSNISITPEFKGGLSQAWGHINITVSF
jgi:lipid A 3-O-deacylase